MSPWMLVLIILLFVPGAMDKFSKDAWAVVKLVFWTGLVGVPLGFLVWAFWNYGYEIVVCVALAAGVCGFFFLINLPDFLRDKKQSAVIAESIRLRRIELDQEQEDRELDEEGFPGFDEDEIVAQYPHSNTARELMTDPTYLGYRAKANLPLSLPPSPQRPVEAHLTPKVPSNWKPFVPAPPSNGTPLGWALFVGVPVFILIVVWLVT